MVDSISKTEAQGVYGNPEIDVTNKVAVLIYPMVIAMAHGKLRIDYSALSKSYFGTVVSRLIKEWDRRSTLRVVSGQWQWSFGHDPYSIDKGDNVVTINSHLNDETEYAVDTTDLIVNKKTSSGLVKDDNLTKTYYPKAYFGTEQVKTPYGDYRGVPTVIDPVGAAQNDNTFNLLMKRVGIQIDPSLHQKDVEVEMKGQLSRFSSGLK